MGVSAALSKCSCFWERLYAPATFSGKQLHLNCRPKSEAGKLLSDGAHHHLLVTTCVCFIAPQLFISYFAGPDLMQMEPQEAVDKLRLTARVLIAFKSYYFDNKARTLQETPNNPWKFQNSALFGRLDAFLDRCNDVLNLSQTALQFHKLERIEIGGTKVRSVAHCQVQLFTMTVASGYSARCHLLKYCHLHCSA